MTPSGVPRCSIVIRAFNEEKHIGKLLTGIMQQTVREVEILVVDSGSTDATVAIASRFPARVLHIAPEDFSFGRSLNLGCAEARAEALVFASAHVYPVYPDWLERLLAPFDDPDVGLVYGRQRGEASSRFSERQQFAKLFPETSVARQRTALCNNANAAVRRSLWSQHPYDEELPGLEDLEWAGWALKQGHVLSYAAEAEVVHVHEETPAQVYNRYRREAIGLARIRPEERFHVWDFAWLLLTNVAHDWWRALQLGELRRAGWEVVWFRFLQFWGTYRGFRHSGPLSSHLKQAFFYPRGPRAPGEPAPRAVEPIDYGGAAERREAQPR